MPIIQQVILAGGSGNRLWPASRSMYPKQLLNLIGKQTMLQDTVTRLNELPNRAARPVVVCNEAHRFLVAQQLAALDVGAHILLEPEGRNTAPAIALAALHALDNKQEAAPTLIIMPADHVVENVDAFLAAVEQGIGATEEGSLVTFGIVPSDPNTGYGYIEAEADSSSVTKAKAFVEKPDLETATEYVERGMHYWNSGMFMFQADRYLQELEKHAPDILAACRDSMADAKTDADFIRPDKEKFLPCPAESIDYAVMEKSDRVMMVSLDAGWSDIGSWSALHAISDSDANNNTIVGDAVLLGCRNSYVSSESRLVTAVGVEDLIIVETKDSILVTRQDRTQDVKLLVEQLEAGEREETSLHRQVFRPWGSYDSIDSDDGFQVKRLIVNPGAILSLQKHNHRAEHWVVVRGTATITLNDDEFELGANQSTHIPIGAMHRIANNGAEPVHIIEVQCGDYLGEDDIVRIEDKYGREGTNT